MFNSLQIHEMGIMIKAHRGFSLSDRFQVANTTPEFVRWITIGIRFRVKNWKIGIYISLVSKPKKQKHDHTNVSLVDALNGTTKHVKCIDIKWYAAAKKKLAFLRLTYSQICTLKSDKVWMTKCGPTFTLAYLRCNRPKPSANNAPQDTINTSPNSRSTRTHPDRSLLPLDSFVAAVFCWWKCAEWPCFHHCILCFWHDLHPRLMSDFLNQVMTKNLKEFFVALISRCRQVNR